MCQQSLRTRVQKTSGLCILLGMIFSSAEITSGLGAPHDVYAQRLAERRGEAERLARLDRVFGNRRLVVFALGLLIAWFAFGSHLVSAWLLLIPLVGFFALASRHDRVIQNKKRAERGVAFYQQGLRRVEDQWQGAGNGGARFLKAEHPYAADLDIFGRASLFELLCTARTRMGENCLADWLQAPRSPDVIRARQQAVEELRTRVDFREDLAVLGEQTRVALKPAELTGWSQEPPTEFAGWERSLLALLVIVTLAAGIFALIRETWTPFVITVLVEQVYVLRLKARVRNAVGTVETPGRELALLGLLLTRIEAEPVTSPRLLELRTLLNAEVAPPSLHIQKLQRLIELLEIPHNPLLALLDKVVQLTPFCAFTIADWKRVNGSHLADWLRVVGEMEALCALSAYAYEHPDDVFPEITPDEFSLEARGLSHPLLPSASAVRNDLEFSSAQRLYIVSGSNMSGKSTLLRALGVNVVLGLAGAPVRAHFLRLPPLRIGASLRTQDSLEAGISRFYAEILRLRQIVGLSEPDTPLLFLLDEILHGTNSHDRRQGAEAILRALLLRPTLGLVTTHDLALARIAEDPALHAANVHLEDQLLEGKMTFDYHLRPGVVAKSNALELMRAIGLEV